MSNIIEIKVPDLGDFDQVEVIEVLVQPNDTVALEQALITLESDKASMEVPATQAGIVREVLVKVGDQVSEGTGIITLVTSDPQPEQADKDELNSEPSPEIAALSKRKSLPKSQAGAAQPTFSSARQIHASPSVRRFARELGVDVAQIEVATGPKGRLLKEDVKNFVKRYMAGGREKSSIQPIPAVDFSQFGEIEEKSLSKIKKRSGENLSRTWLNLPMVTHHELADITETEQFRKSVSAEAETRGVKLTLLPFVMKALVATLKKFSGFNASLSADGNTLILKKYYHLGLAVDTPNGLLVPVLKNVDRKNIYTLAEELSQVSEKARAGKLSWQEMQGGCMTISNLGGVGGAAFTPIINAPEVAILGLSRAGVQPIWDGNEFMPRRMLPMDMTYDHRVIDGAAAARFMATLAAYLSDLRRLLL